MQASSCQPSERKPEKPSLILAVKRGNFVEVKQCLNQGKDPNVADENGNTPLHWACYYDKKGTIIELLLREGANIYAKDIDGWISLDWAEKGNNTSAIKQLIEKAIDMQNVNIRGQNGQTLLHYAATLSDNKRQENEAQEIVQKLLALQSDVNVQDDNGCTPLHEAVKNQNINIVEMLVKAGACTDIQDNNGYTPLKYAQKNNIIVPLLLATTNRMVLES